MCNRVINPAATVSVVNLQWGRRSSFLLFPLGALVHGSKNLFATPLVIDLVWFVLIFFVLVRWWVSL
jgi:hypothetical protein